MIAATEQLAAVFDTTVVTKPFALCPAAVVPPVDFSAIVKVFFSFTAVPTRGIVGFAFDGAGGVTEPVIADLAKVAMTTEVELAAAYA